MRGPRLALRRDHGPGPVVMLLIDQGEGKQRKDDYPSLPARFIRVLRVDSRLNPRRLSVAARSYVAASQDKPLRSIRPGVAGRRRAWERASVASGNRIQDAHIPPAGESARSHSAGRSAILRHALRQTGHYQHNDWQAGADTLRHSQDCRNRAVRFPREWLPLLLPGTFRQSRRPEANAQERASQWKFFRSDKKRGKPQHSNPSSSHPESKDKLQLFVELHMPVCKGPLWNMSRSAIRLRMLDFCNDRAQPPSHACPIPGTESR